MEAVIDEALGDVHGVHALLFLAIIAEDDFMHGRRGVGQVENAFEILTNVIGVQDSIFGGLTNAGAIGECVCEGANQHAEIAAKRAHAADGLRAHRFERQLAIFLHEHRNGEERLEMFFHQHWAGARPTAAVRSGKRLVQIEVHDVHAEAARLDHAGERVHIGAVHVKLGAAGVEQVGDFGDAGLEGAKRGRIGDHERGNVIVDDVF